LYVKTDATAGQQLFICNTTGDGFVLMGDGGSGSTLPTASASVLGGVKIGSGLSIDGSGVVTAAGGGGGTINSGAGNGAWLPFGVSSYAPGGYVIGGIGRAVRYQLIVPAQMEFRSLNFSIYAASGTCGGVCGFQASIHTADMSSIVAATTTATSGGTPNINATGAARFLFGSGPAVSAGVLTLPPGPYWLVLATDSTALILSTYGDAVSSNLVNATTTTGSILGTRFSSLSNSAAHTGTGASLAIIGNLSSMGWTANPANAVVFALVN